jgi:hypothetical protein
MPDLEIQGSLDAAELGVLDQVFDDIWRELGPEVDLEAQEITRRAIATVLMRAAETGERDLEKLRCLGMQRARMLASLHWMMAKAPPSA